MAELAQMILSPIIEKIVDELVTLLRDEIGMLRGVGDEIRTFSCKLEIIQAYVIDAEEKQSTDISVKPWLKKLKDIAYKAEDVIDEFTTKQRVRQIKKEQACNFSFVSPCIKHVRAFHETGTRLKEINGELENILNLRVQLNLRPRAGDENIRRVERTPTGPFVDEPRVYGRDEDRQTIINMLSSPAGTGGQSSIDDAVEGQYDHYDHFSVIVIVGMGGIGKTTLAQQVYNEVDDQLFQQKIWICVSDDFNVTRIIQLIIEFLSGKKCEVSQMGLLQTQLQQKLRGNKYLLVLDDVWNEDPLEWGRLAAPLRQSGAHGSKVLVTTRSTLVAHAMRIRDPYILRGLADDDCWSLFLQTAFTSRKEAEEFPRLVKIGQEIVKNCCKGVPLAAKALGGILFPYREESDWLHIQEAGISDPSDDEKVVLSILRLSYDHLPSHLKQCFGYCSLFPKDSEIHVDQLVQYWIAHGFIHPSGGRPFEDIGYGYFNQLLWRSFFQDVTMGNLGNIRSCKMHDLFHDLAQSVTGGEYSIFMPLKSTDESHSISPPHSTIVESFQKLQNLRTFSQVNFDKNIQRVVLDQMFSSLKYVRVLDLNMRCEGKILKSIGTLIHLRFLKLGYIESSGMLPSSICNLLNLETLEVPEVVPEQLPRGISRLKRLRHLRVNCIRGDRMPQEMGQLKSLVTLNGFVVSKDRGCRLDELGDLQFLGGELGIYKLEHVRNSEEAKQAKLIDKYRLRQLDLRWSFGASAENEEQVLESLRPHQNVKGLGIFYYLGQCFPSWLMASSCLPNLMSLYLYGIHRCELFPPLLQFPCLQYVYASEVKVVKQLEFSISGCPRLKAIHLRNIFELEIVYQRDESHKSWWLQELSLGFCPSLTSLSVVQSMRLELLQITRCPKLTSLPIIFSVTNLLLEHCDSRILTSVRSLTSLHSLIIGDFKELECLPDGMLQNHLLLEKLEINRCQNLINLGDLNNPPALKSLKIFRCEKLNSLPEWLQDLPCLRELALGPLGNELTSLPQGLGNLTSLRSFTIDGLKHVTDLPTGLLHLPLQNLKVANCPISRQRYDHLIQHIPSVSIL